MKKINLDFLYPLSALIILIYALSVQIFSVPPLGKLINPFTGIVQNDQDQEIDEIKLDNLNLGLSDTVSVFFDKYKIPHIYAKNSQDLYFAQGYVTAKLRLWQMDFLSYTSAGRLSEIFNGENYLQYDRNQRRLGILEAAKKSLKFIEKNQETIKILSAYTKGVNAYIKQLNYKNMPVEYKLLDYKPEPWSNLKSVLILKLMGNTLSGYDEDMIMSKLILILGEKKFNRFYPDFQPNPTSNANNSNVRRNGVFNNLKQPGFLDYSFLSSSSIVSNSSYNSKLGSNSWVVSGGKTKSGFPILANDPHLNLSLPCIWLQMQLSSPQVNVYGVSIPGTPAIIIGFNKNVAWGITNGADDVKDWYKLKISADYKKYELNGTWLNLNYRIEVIKRKGQKAFYDTVYSTVYGPVPYNRAFAGPQPEFMDYALKWELTNPSNEFLTFIKLNSSRNYQDYNAALRTYSCPIQNFTFASNDNTIAFNHQGRMRIKYPGQGKFIMDGSKTSFATDKYIPFDSLPQQLNPACNYIVSANQHPTEANFKYYYNGYYSENRANQIKKMLESESNLDIKKMQRIQLDNTNYFASVALPELLKKIDSKRLSSSQKIYLGSLKTWNGEYNFNDENAKLFELLWGNIKSFTWDELTVYPFYLRFPDDYVLLDLIENDSSNIYFDKMGTSKIEKANDIITEAFIIASEDLIKLKKKGSIKWGSLNKVNITHMTQIPAFSVLNLNSSGYPEAINAISNSWGPSWRMIVELGQRPRAYGIYPGGQSGNVGSKYYDDFIDDWNKGKYYELNFYLSMAEAKTMTNNVWKLK